MKKRLPFIDISRGIAIFLIVFGHTISGIGTVYPFFRLLYSFHVILFFIISGYIYNSKGDFKSFTWKKFKSLMIPYFIFSILFIIPYLLFTTDIKNMFITNDFSNILNLFKEILWGNGNDGRIKPNTSLWFLPALFTTEVLYKLSDMLNKTKFKHILNIIIFTIICYFGTKMPIDLPWGFNSALCMLVFFEIGYLMKEMDIIVKINKSKIFQLCLLVLIIIAIPLSQINGTVACVNYFYGNNFFIFYFVALVLSIAVLCISYIMKNNKIMEYMGKNSISILIFHKLLIYPCQYKINFTSSILNSGNTILIVVTALIISIVSIIFSILIGVIINKYFPFLYGKINVNNKELDIQNSK